MKTPLRGNNLIAIVGATPRANRGAVRGPLHQVATARERVRMIPDRNGAPTIAQAIPQTRAHSPSGEEISSGITTELIRVPNGVKLRPSRQRRPPAKTMLILVVGAICPPLRQRHLLHLDGVPHLLLRPSSNQKRRIVLTTRQPLPHEPTITLMKRRLPLMYREVSRPLLSVEENHINVANLISQ